MAISSYADLKYDVERHGNVKSYNMKIIREAHGAGKLGPTVIENIKSNLQQNGLGHYPAELPMSQWEDVRIYVIASQVGSIIEACKDISPTSDTALKGFADVPGRKRTIEKLKELVADLN